MNTNKTAPVETDKLFLYLCTVEDIKINQLLETFEREASDEFSHLLSVGSKFFPTADLLYLKGLWVERYTTFLRLHRILLVVAASSPVLLLLGTALAFLSISLPALVLIILAPITFLAFLAGSYALKRAYNSRGHLEYIGMLINDEINSRMQEKRIKRS